MSKKILLLFCVLFIYAVPAVSSDIEVEPVMITAGRIEQELKDVPMSVGTVTEEQMLESPKSTVADYLEGIPGVFVQKGSTPGGAKVTIRGESSKRVVLMIDGVKISEQKSMDGPAMLVDPGNIERVEVIKGPSSVLYGSEAIGGVVNIITKKPGKKPIGFSLRFTADSSVKSFEPFASLHGNYEGFIYRFTASGVNAVDRQTPSGKLKDTGYSRRNYTGLVGYEWNGGSIQVKAESYKSTIHSPKQIFGNSSASLQLPKWDRDTISTTLILDNITDNFVKLSIAPYYQFMKKDFEQKLPILYVNTVNKQKSYGGLLQTEWLVMDSHYALIGLDYNKDLLDAETLRIISGRRLIRKVNGDKAERSDMGLFAEDNWSINDNWKFNIGLRQTWFNSKLTDTSNPSVKKDSKSSSNLSASTGLIFTVDDLALRANFSQGYKFPDASALFIGGGMGGNVLPNKDLKAEKSNNYELGARYAGESLSFDTAVFYTDSKDYIMIKDISAIKKKYVNYDKAKTYGVELSMAYAFDMGLTPYTTFTHIKRKVWEDDFTTTDTATPPYSGKLGLRFDKAVYGDLKFFSDLDLTWADKTKKRSSTSLITYKAWETVNMSLGVKGGKEHRYYATISVRNIFNRKYTQAGITHATALEEPGTHCIATMGYNF